MSPKTTSRQSKPIFQPYIWAAILAVFMAIILSQWAVADPQSQAGPQESTVETMEETVDPPIEQTPAVEQEAIEGATAQIVEPVPDDMMTSVPASSLALADKCYEQADGSFEGVCEGDAECEKLQTAEHCQAGTHWGKDGFGGCTRKSRE